MRRFLSLYQFIVPLVLLPLAIWLWQGRFGSLHFTLYGLAIPVVFAYVIPAIGTNHLKLWEFNTRFRVGKFRPHHGFMFGTGTALLAMPCLVAPVSARFDIGTLLQMGFLMGTVLAFWNWVYDVAAIGSGFITMYNQPYAEDRGPEAIVSDYAPVYFGTFGVVYGMAAYLGQVLLLGQGRWELYGLLLVGSTLLGMAIPTASYIAFSYWRHGHNGLTAFRKPETLESVVPSARVEAEAPATDARSLPLG